jgi:ubiquinone/menaquinone biosynthesis C-methylase UbiE
MKVDYDKVARLYARFRRVHPVVLEHLPTDLNASSRVLEVGCGSGNYISTISKMIDRECHGIEPSEAMLSEAQQEDAATLWRKGSARGIRRMSKDLLRGAIECNSRYTMLWATK